jgi:hypothetical protein
MPAGFPGAATPRPTRVPFVAPSLPTRAPRSTPDARVQWPPDVPAFLPPGAAAVDVSEVDTDGDGVKQMLVIYTLDGFGHGLVIRREGVAGRAYALGGGVPAGTGPSPSAGFAEGTVPPMAVPQAGSLPPAELFRERWGENIVADVNGDDRNEVVVEGVSSGSAETLSVFQWNGSAYVSLLSLSGAEGVAVDDPQKNGMLEFIALELLVPRSAMTRGTHAAWRDAAYRQWGDVRFLLGTPLRFNHPEEAALAYYVFWSQAQPEKMAALLADPQRSLTTLEGLAAQTRAFDLVSVASLRVDEEHEAAASVTVDARILARGSQTETTARHIWRLVKLDGEWRLAELQQP